MKDEFIGKYFTKQPADYSEEVDLEGEVIDHALLEQTQKIVDRIELLKQMQQVDSERGFNTVQHRLEKRKTGKWMIQLSKVAAVMLIPLLAFALWQTHRISLLKQTIVVAEMSTPATLRSQFTLPDGTQVWLNGSSTIKYPTQFVGSERLVELEGEAYFKVAHDKSKPFLVKTGELLVQAIGTEFNCSAYSDDSKIETVLTEGKVAIFIDGSKGRKELTTLEPNQRVVYNKTTNQLAKDEVSVNKYIAWRDGKIIFNNEPVNEVLLRLGRWYNVEFILDKPLKDDYAFTGTFAGEELTQILNYIELTTPVRFEILKTEQNKDKLYLKTKIRIKTKK